MKPQTTPKTEHLVHEALEHSIQHGYTDETYIKGRACVSKAFADKLIELVMKEYNANHRINPSDPSPEIPKL